MVNTVKLSIKVICVLLIVGVALVPATMAAGVDKYDLSLYEYRQVAEKGRGSLVFQGSPRGSAIKGFK